MSKKNFIAKIEEKKNIIIQIVFWIATILYGLFCLYIYYNQSIQPLDESNRYFQSDLPYHISMIVDDGWYYSLTAYAYILLYRIAGNTTIGIAIFLALVSVATILLTEKLLGVLGIQDKMVTCGGALVLNLIMPFYIRWAGAYRYVSYQSPNIWHNSTYQCMKPAAIGCIIFYLYLKRKYEKEGIKVIEWIGFSAALAVTTGIKPSFLTVFAPVFAIKLLIDLIGRRAKFWRIFAFGSTVFPALGVILWQNSVLFGSDTENGFTISFMESFSFHADHPKITVLLSVAFPVIVVLSMLTQYIIDSIKDKERMKRNRSRAQSKRPLISAILTEFDTEFVFAMTVMFVGFMEAALLIETGSRSRDGNFLWGYSIAIFWMECLCFKKWYEMIEKKRWVRLIICGLVLAYQLFCGTVFLYRLYLGETYFMIF